MMPEERSIATVGAGLVGSGWALVFARAGYAVRAYDPSEEVREGILSWASDSLKDLAEIGLVEDPDAILARISVHDTLSKAVEGVFYVQESVFETVEAKSAVSHELDAVIGDDVVVGSSSSGIPASQFTEGCKNRARFSIVHPVNPPHLVPVVEIVPAPWTEQVVLEQIAALMQEVGQVPVRLTREIDGFVLNRLQGVLLNEAWALYQDGIASLADIDATVAHGLGLRWSFMGPFETIDLNAPGGIEDYAARLRGLYAGMVRTPPPGPWPDDVIARAAEERRAELPLEDLAGRRAWRDARLSRLASFKKNQGLMG
ncbi:3-hydroxyacyl-CoA dehydrogenase [Sediminimonas qiaohouensis]|uniref:3-hydroxyacyl-CoA dehydrogenase n=1 Tax=Sediminimonas qiaohouensis TaxID=552061 RepID=UPI001FE0E9BA|nr:3-hydroxyacyl-CoA dehydrogenase [Sediminimonas qiaohouensis]